MRAERAASRLAAAIRADDLDEAVRQAARWCDAMAVAPSDVAAVLSMISAASAERNR